jgi:hypothetical protein
MKGQNKSGQAELRRGHTSVCGKAPERGNDENQQFYQQLCEVDVTPTMHTTYQLRHGHPTFENHTRTPTIPLEH